jgi:hypothetical protein
LTRKVFIGIPTRSADCKIQMTASLVDAVYELGQADMAMSLFCWSGDPLISHARNVILAQFMKTDCDDLVFIDDDVSWEHGALTRLIKHPVDLVAGVYRHKKDDETYPLNFKETPDGQVRSDLKTGLIEVRDVPFGFTRITRSCAQRLYDAAADVKFVHSNAPDLDCRVVFNVEYHEGQYFGEDYTFCRKWRDMGGKVWVDPEMALNHTGTKVYMGHLGNFLRKVAEDKPPSDLKAAIEQATEALKQAAA